MNRRAFLLGSGGLLLAPPLTQRLAGQAAPAPLAESHFPDRFHQYVWRNWELANSDRMALAVGCRPQDILEAGARMGLPPKSTLSGEQLRRIYISVIRQNWHLLPNKQLIELLGWDREKFAFTLKEDDFLDIKLGPKPACTPVAYSEPSAAVQRRASEIRSLLRAHLGSELGEAGEAPFRFVERLSDASFRSQRIAGAGAPEGHLDLSECRLEAEDSVDAGIVERFAQYLDEAMGVKVGVEARKRVELRLDGALSQEPEAYRVGVDESGVEIIAGDRRGLLQGVYRLQEQMEEAGGPFVPRGTTGRHAVFNPRYLYSYFALYGDPLMESDINPFPDAYLEKLARSGMNGVWLQAVLNTLAPSKHFPEFGAGSQRRLENLNALVERAKRFGMRIYLYLNEPRAMPAEFFEGRTEIQGEPHRDLYSMCTSTPVVREWLADSIAHITRQAPELGGFFCITMSENHTNCFSHGNSWGEVAPEAKVCPRCSQRKSWEALGELIGTFHEGIRRSSATADLIVWDWGWPAAMSRQLIPKLPPGARFMSISEWDQPVQRGGVKTKVGEYSISVVGPGPRATANWELARAAGIPAMAKTQFNNTWEISAIPYIPVPNLIARHCAKLLQAGVSGTMCSWTLGGYPSPNLETAKEFFFSPREEPEEILARVARRRYGAQAAPAVLAAWKAFSAAFEEFPYGVHVYIIPTQHGPANLLRAAPTGIPSSMILFPQDNYQQWSGDYPPAVVRDQFAKMAEMWGAALPPFRRALETVPRPKQARALEDLAIAETCFLHFRSVAVQMEFYMLRERGIGMHRDRLRALAKEQLDLARRLYPLARRHAVIGYEATNHYYYRPLDLAEQIVNCQYLLEHGLKPVEDA